MCLVTRYSTHHSFLMVSKPSPSVLPVRATLHAENNKRVRNITDSLEPKYWDKNLLHFNICSSESPC